MDAPATRRVAVLASFAVVALAMLLGWLGLSRTLRQVAGGLPALPLALLVHASQLALAGLGWRALLPVRLPVWVVARARWLREATNSLIPSASLGGSVVGARLLARDGRVGVALAGASAAADITGEAIAQVLFLVCGLAAAASLRHSPVSAWWVAAVCLPVLAALAALIGVQALGGVGWIERLAERYLPARMGVAGIADRLGAIYADRARVIRDVGYNFLAWSVGAVEVWVLLRGLGVVAGWRAAYAVESLGLVARSAFFMVPGGIAAQETGFVLACALFGIAHPTGLAMSLLKRVRELIVGVVGVLYWQWLEHRAWRR